MHLDVIDSMHSCILCQLWSKHHKVDTLNLLEVIGPFIHIHIDVIGPFVCSFDGKKYIVAAHNSFTKWLETYLVAKNDSTTIAKFLWEDIVT